MVLDRLEAPTSSALQHALRREDYHIFHFIMADSMNKTRMVSCSSKMNTSAADR
jgi:hypothetical protein